MATTSVVGDRERFFAAPGERRHRWRALYAAHPDATLVAGATDVGLWVTKGMASLDKVIWLGRVAGLDEIEDGARRARASARR